MTLARTFVRDGVNIEVSELKKGDVFYFYDGDLADLKEFRLWKFGGMDGDTIVAKPLTIMVIGDRNVGQRTDQELATDQ